MLSLKGKKILVLGAASVHLKLINTAKELGAYTIATDNIAYRYSPCKQAADEYYDLNIYDVDGIIKKCKEDNIDGVVCGWLDPCQRPYFKICKELNLPCYGSEEQFFKMTDKRAFKQMCRENGVGVIPEFSIKDFENKKIDFPVFVKPIDSRGSRGQSVCYNYEELEKAIDFAKQESSNGDILIEKYIRGGQEFHVTYFFKNGTPYLLRTSDNYCGSEEMNMQKVVSCAVMPSKYTKTYLETANENVVKMFKKLGIKNGPIFMQGFQLNGEFLFFDPGLRFPGVDYELVYKKVFGTDLMKAMLQIACYGKCDVEIPKDGAFLNGFNGAVLYLTVKAGKIAKLCGENAVRNSKNVISYQPRCAEGDVIKWNYNVNQRLAEIDLLANNIDGLKNAIHFVHENIVATNENGEDAIFARFDTDRLFGY